MAKPQREHWGCLFWVMDHGLLSALLLAAGCATLGGLAYYLDHRLDTVAFGRRSPPGSPRSGTLYVGGAVFEASLEGRVVNFGNCHVPESLC